MMDISLFAQPLCDEVLNAEYLVGYTTYGTAIDKLYPLIQQLGIQRNLQNPSFYARLRNDLKKGCVIPPITVAFIDDRKHVTIDAKYVNENIKTSFVLDGLQRLNAINMAFLDIEEAKRGSYRDRILHLNIIVAPSMDRLLYRMITLNNGQKPMSPRHQIDILSETIFDFDNLTLRNQTHKQKQTTSNKLEVHRSDIVKGYIAYLSNTTSIDNKLIIEEKMDELIAERIIDSDISSDKYEFLEILIWIADMCVDANVNRWFVASNNFIGFCVAARKNFDELRCVDINQLNQAIKKFERIFLSFDKRKIKVGDYRRKMVAEFFGALSKFIKASDSDVIIDLSEK